jgi:hypothetical protein
LSYNNFDKEIKVWKNKAKHMNSKYIK